MIAAQQRDAKRIDRAFSSRYNVENPLSGSNSVVECDLAKVEVAGSTPVSRSKVSLAVAPRTREGLCSQGQHRRALSSGRGTQVVRERSAKPLCVGSIPTRASKVYASRLPILSRKQPNQKPANSHSR